MSREYEEINEVRISGKIMSEPVMRRPGKNRYPILEFIGETAEYVGNAKRPEMLKWRAKAFGKLADKLNGQLAKGMWVIVSGRWSAYAHPEQKGKAKAEQRYIEINAKDVKVFPAPSVSFSVEMIETHEEAEGDHDGL